MKWDRIGDIFKPLERLRSLAAGAHASAGHRVPFPATSAPSGAKPSRRLARVRLDRTRAAKRLGLTRTQLYLRLRSRIEKPSSGRKPVTLLIATEVGLDPGGFRVSEC